MTIAQQVEALTTAIDVALHMAVVNLHVCRTGKIDIIESTVSTALLGRATPDSSNLATTIETVTDDASPQRDVRVVHITIIVVTTTIGIAAVFQSVVGRSLRVCSIRPSLVVDFLYIISILIFIAYIGIIDGQVGRTIDGTSLTTAISITLDDRYTLVEAIASRQCGLILADTDHHIGNTGDISGIRSIQFALMLTYRTFPAAAIDITDRTALNIGIGCGCERIQAKLIQHGTAGTCGVEVFAYDPPMQTDIGRSAHGCIGTQATTIAVTIYSSTLIDIYIRVRFAAQGIFLNQRVFKSVVGVTRT